MLIGFSLLLLSVVEGRGPRHPTASVNNNNNHHHNHHHSQPSPDKKFLQDDQLLHDKQHIVEDLGEWADDKQMSDEEMEFKYFKAHDLDNNTQLDGLEIYQAIKHTYDSSANRADDSDESLLEKEANIVELIDQLLEDNDTNNDGYLSYSEYLIGRNRKY